MQSKSNKKLIWRDVKGFEGIYKISNSGLLYRCTTIKNKNSIKKHLIKRNKTLSKNGSCFIPLCKGDKIECRSLASIVATAFVANPHDYKHIRFKDGNVTHVAADNLQWVPPDEATNYIGKPIYKIDFYGNILEKYTSGIKASKQFPGKYTHKVLYACARKELNTYHGHGWVYKEDY